MSNDASSVLSVARGEIGYSRWTDPEAGTKYGRWYAEKTGEPYYGESGVPYCAMFVSWVFAQAGATCPGLPGAYCPYVERDGRNAGRAVDKASAQPGDVVLFDWGGDGVVDHVGIVEANNGSYLTTIEGNTSSGGGSQSNGGVVARRTRAFSSVRCVLRPTYGGTASGPSKVGKIAVDGYWGSDTTLLAQRVAGTPVDGVVSSQDAGWRSVLPGCTSGWEWVSHPVGSQLVMAVQRACGVEADGIFGRATANAFIRRYGNGVCDGRIDAPSIAVMGFQRALNEGHL